MKYKEWLRRWLAYHVKPYVKERTYQKYESQTKLHIIPNLGEYEMEDLRATILQEFVVLLSEGGFAANTVNGIITVIKLSLRRAVALDLIKKEYSNCIQRPKIREKQVECFSQGEQRKIEKHISEKSKPKLFGVILCLYTGMRIGELLALEWKDVDFQKGIITISKSCHDAWREGEYRKVIETPKTESSIRVIPLPKQLLSRLKALKKHSSGNYIIGGERVHGIHVRSYQRTFERLLQRLELPHKSFHSLRHTFATRALECGMDVKTLSEILGHKNPTITLKRYAHSMLEHKIEMMNRLGKLLQ